MTGTELRAMFELAEATHTRPGCRPLDRADWPAVCEARIAADLAAVRRLAGPVSETREVPS
jgi:hypothetical protein